MANELKRPVSHNECVSQLRKNIIFTTWFTRTEFDLPSGKVADLIAIDDNNQVHIYEVKTDFRPSIVKEVYEKYNSWCNYLYIALPQEIAHIVEGGRYWGSGFDLYESVGLIRVLPDVNIVVRPSIHHTLHNQLEAELARAIDRVA